MKFFQKIFANLGWFEYVWIQEYENPQYKLVKIQKMAGKTLVEFRYSYYFLEKEGKMNSFDYGTIQENLTWKPYN